MKTQKTMTCLICTAEWMVNEKRVAAHLYCRECRTSETRIDYGLEKHCLPWTGDFDDEDNPMRNGMAYKPGIRTCNHRDCVQVAHIIADPVLTGEQLIAKRNAAYYAKSARTKKQQKLIAELHSIYYRTGVQLNYNELLATLKKERNK